MKEKVTTKELYIILKSLDTWVAEYRKWTDKVEHGMPYHFGHSTISLPKELAVVEHVVFFAPFQTQEKDEFYGKSYCPLERCKRGFAVLVRCKSTFAPRKLHSGMVQKHFCTQKIAFWNGAKALLQLRGKGAKSVLHLDGKIVINIHYLNYDPWRDLLLIITTEHAPVGLVASISATLLAKGGIRDMCAPNLANWYFWHLVHCKECRSVVNAFESWRNAPSLVALVSTGLAILVSGKQWKALRLVSTSLCLAQIYSCSTAIAMDATNFVRTHWRL
ncbi:hypothetical protein LguiB_011665 [Lonicera macranthoides]